MFSAMLKNPYLRSLNKHIFSQFVTSIKFKTKYRNSEYRLYWWWLGRPVDVNAIVNCGDRPEVTELNRQMEMQATLDPGTPCKREI